MDTLKDRRYKKVLEDIEKLRKDVGSITTDLDINDEKLTFKEREVINLEAKLKGLKSEIFDLKQYRTGAERKKFKLDSEIRRLDLESQGLKKELDREKIHRHKDQKPGRM